MTTLTDQDLAAIAKKLLERMPEVEKVSSVDLQPADVLVVECQAHLPHAVLERIKAMVNNIWPNHRVVVIDQGLKLRVLREREAKTAPTVEEAAAMIRQAIRVAAQDGREDGIEEILEALVAEAKDGLV